MEQNTIEFNQWLNRMLIDAETKLHLTTYEIGFILIQKGLTYYYKDIQERKIC
jgi:hypothetical protein